MPPNNSASAATLAYAAQPGGGANQDSSASALVTARAKLPHLTRRGAGLLIAAAAIGFLAAVFRQVDMARLAIFAAALPLVSWLYLAVASAKLQVARTAHPAVVRYGSTITIAVHYQLSKLSPALLAYDDVPEELGDAPPFVVTPAPTETDQRSYGGSQRGPRVVRYSLTGRRRGVWQLGQLHAQCVDPLTLATRRYVAEPPCGVTVLPEVHDVSIAIAQDGGHRSGQGNSPDSGTHGSPDASVRGYRQGDDIRRVHWRTTARRGELMVRNSSRREDNIVIIAVNSSQVAHDLHGDSFEWSVSAAASLMVHLLSRGWEVHLVDAAAAKVVDNSDPASMAAGLLHLAQAQETHKNVLQDLVHAVIGSGKAKTAIVFPGVVSASDAALLSHLTTEFPTGMIVPFVPSSDGTLPAKFDNVRPEHLVQTYQQLSDSAAHSRWSCTAVDPTIVSVRDAFSSSAESAQRASSRTTGGGA